MPDVVFYQHAVEEVVDRVVQSIAERRVSPCATYRLQFHAGFTFRDAAAIVPYLRELGITHVYASPYARARAGSMHGYDVCDHNQLNPELGGEEGYRAFIDALRDNELRHVLDVVPNHMAATADNPWWRDVLENGPNSPYSGFFDIDWRPVKDELENKVLIPVLGAQYGEVLESGQLQIEHVDGGFVIKYFDRSFPFGPKSAIPLLSHRLEELRTQLGAESESVHEYQSIITALEHLPPPTATTLKAVNERQREKEIIKRRLRELEAREPAVAAFIELNVQLFNGRAGEPESYDRLDRLLQSQSYRLCHWRAASDEINYRRFFDINDLAALCIEKPEAFHAANELVARLLADDLVDGLRIDHVDGLYAPEEYLWRLQYVNLAQRLRRDWEAATDHAAEANAWEVRLAPTAEAEHEGEASSGAAVALAAPTSTSAKAYHLGPELLRRVCSRLGLRAPRPADFAAVFGTGHQDVAELEAWQPPQEAAAPVAVAAPVAPLYVLVEKILGPDEPLPESWPVAGTTGYDFTHLLNSLFITPEGYAAVEKQYLRFTGESRRYPDVVRECKRMIVRFSMASELQMLAHRVNRLSEQHRKSRDFTLNALRYALREVLASFPVYRTYPGPDGVSERDQRFVNRAVAVAKRRNQAMDPTTFDFIREILLLRHPPGLSESSIRAREEFAGKFQQVTSPVMAKGVEDTAFYVYSPLASANEVGGDLSSPTCGISRFHAENTHRSLRQRGGLLTTTTHDTKRTEDVRARIHVLSEIPKQWAAAVSRWNRLTRGWRQDVDGAPAPRPEDEYLFYQNLLGIWPGGPVDDAARAQLTERLQNYMEKATREAKQNTSWINPNAEYDQAVRQFVAKCLAPGRDNRFLAHFAAFHKRIAAAGYYTALSQTVLKFLSPGVPDIYQGQELWDFSLVDPDNRRPVDYHHRRALLEQVRAGWNTRPEQRTEFAAALARAPHDERLKLFVTWRLLTLRSDFAELLRNGDYTPLTVSGAAADHVIAFSWRSHQATEIGDGEPTVRCPGIVVVVPRFWAKLAATAEFEGIAEAMPRPELLWGDTHVEIPGVAGNALKHALTDERHAFDTDNVPLAWLLERFPVAILTDDRSDQR
ncbi:MAG: malto-oligosyltrehalose synthase [Pirellula sp.]|nr:malto-oligosyltrehalose synthase [Pirellula sp.]